MLELLDHRDFAVAGGDALDCTNFARTGIKFQFGAVDMFCGYHAGQRRGDDFARSGGYHEKGKPIAFRASLHEFNQRGNRTLETNATARLHEVFPANAAKFRIVTNQIGELAALLYQIAPCKARNAVFKTRYSQQLAQHESRIVETQSLIKV